MAMTDNSSPAPTAGEALCRICGMEKGNEQHLAACPDDCGAHDYRPETDGEALLREAKAYHDNFHPNSEAPRLIRALVARVEALEQDSRLYNLAMIEEAGFSKLDKSMLAERDEQIAALTAALKEQNINMARLSDEHANSGEQVEALAAERDAAEAKFAHWSGTDVPALNIALNNARQHIATLTAEVTRLRAQCEEMQSRHDLDCQLLHDEFKAREAAEQRLSALVDGGYVQHKKGCVLNAVKHQWMTGPSPCTCGLANVLRAGTR